MSRKESLVRGAAALALAGLIIKVSNLLVRVPLTRLIQAEGLGIYQMALPAFWALFHLAAGGVPVAVQNLVAEYVEKGRGTVAVQVKSLALTYTLLTGGIATLILMLGALPLAKLLGEPRTYWPLVALAPAVILSAVDAIYRSYLQGRKLMTPSATASIFEQGTKVIVTLVAAYLMLPLGRERAAGGAAFGITAGSAVSLLYMIYCYRQIRAEDTPGRYRYESRAYLVRRMLSLAWPVTLGSITMPLLSLLDVGLIRRGFVRAGYSQNEATALYGAYSGIAVQVVWFPFVLTNALANALVPVLTAARARGDEETVQERVLLGLRTAGLICLPVALGVAVLARPIAGLFGDPRAAVPLLYMAPIAYLGPLSWMMTAQLQALGRTGIPMRNYMLTTVLKIGLDSVVAPIRNVDVKGVALAGVLMFFTSCWLNARALEQELDEPLPWGWLLRGPLVASVIMGGALFGLAAAGLLPRAGWGSLSAAVAVAPVIYLITLLTTRAVTWSELKELSGPVGTRLERWFNAFWTWG